MLTQEVLEYIEKHKLCSNYIFANWKEFLDLLYSQGSYVEGILWFEHVHINEQINSLGSGGYKDKTDPEYIHLFIKMIWKTKHNWKLKNT